MQNPCASIQSAVLNLLRLMLAARSHAIYGVPGLQTPAERGMIRNPGATSYPTHLPRGGSAHPSGPRLVRRGQAQQGRPHMGMASLGPAGCLENTPRALGAQT